jgi:hypothetical protein
LRKAKRRAVEKEPFGAFAILGSGVVRKKERFFSLFGMTAILQISSPIRKPPAAKPKRSALVTARPFAAQGELKPCPDETIPDVTSRVPFDPENSKVLQPFPDVASEV